MFPLHTLGFANKYNLMVAYKISLSSAQTDFTANLQVVEILTCTTYTMDSGGGFVVSIEGGQPRVFYPRGGLVRSGVCGL